MRRISALASKRWQVGELLDVARRIFNNRLTATHGLLRQLQRERRRG